VRLIGTEAPAGECLRIELPRLHVVFDDENEGRRSGDGTAGVPLRHLTDVSGA